MGKEKKEKKRIRKENTRKEMVFELWGKGEEKERKEDKQIKKKRENC